MAGKPEVVLTFTGDTGSLERSFDKVGSAAKEMDDDVRTAGGGLDRVGESSDQLEGRFTGLASGIDGVTTLMDPQSPQEFAQGIADLADGIANAAVPALQRMVGWMRTSAIETARSAAQHVASAASS